MIICPGLQKAGAVHELYEAEKITGDSLYKIPNNFDKMYAVMKSDKYMIKRAKIEDAEALAGLAIQMWTDHDPEDLTAEFRQVVTNDEAVCFIKYVDGKPIGFSQCQLRRDYVEGTESSPVGYLEGIFVADGYRARGYAAELLSECEKWAREKGCTEFASDCEIGNIDSLKFHMALGFEEANRIICFKKDL